MIQKLICLIAANIVIIILLKQPHVVHHAPDVAALMAEVYKALKPGGEGMFLIAEPSHHASAEYCAATETAARQVGFIFADHPKLTRDWAVLFLKNKKSPKAG